MSVIPASDSIKERMMRKTLCASVLFLVLCVPAFAGDVTNPPAPATFDVSINTTQSSGEQPAEGRVGTGTLDPSADGIIYGDYVDDMASAALTFITSALALL